MRKLLFFTIFASSAAFGQFEVTPDSPLDANMGEAAPDATSTLNQTRPNEKFERQQEEQRQEELLENRYDVPDDKEEEEFNENGP